MEIIKKILGFLPFPQNFFLRIFVGLFYVYVALGLFPLFVTFLIFRYFYKRNPKKTMQYGGISAAIFFAFVAGVGITADTQSTPTTTEKVAEAKKAEPTLMITETPAPTATVTIAPSVTIQKSRIPTANPTKKISTPTPTKKIVYPTATPKPYVAPATSTPAPQVKSFSAPVQSGSSGGDKDCGDFGPQSEAQAYFNNKGGSPSNNVDGLDRDHDGIACENNP